MLLHPAFAGLLALTTAIPTSQTPFDKLENLPRSWSLSREASSDELAKFSIYLRQRNIEHLEQFVLNVSNPNHAFYGQHMPKQQLFDLTKPSAATFNAIRSWLAAYDVTGIHEGKLSVVFWTTVEKANTIFDTKFDWYKSTGYEDEELRTTQYSVPAHVAGHIDYVHPTIKFPTLKGMKSAIHRVEKVKDMTPLATEPHVKIAVPDAAASCNNEITPTCLLQLYNVYYTANATSGNKVAFASFLKQYARTKDLTKFENALAPWAKGTSFNVILLHNGKNAQGSSADPTEANLDDQYLQSLAYPVPVTEFSTGGCGPLTPDPNEPKGSCSNEPYLPFLTGVLALDDSKLPQTISISYGEDEQTWPKKQAVSVCNMFMQLAARGVSVLVASGDSGPGAICENNSGSKDQFVPNFPASCPFVTTVGATQNIGPEVVASFSGGGFSNYFDRPSFQDSAVKTYLSTLGTEYSQYYNASGRAYPDVAAQGTNFNIYGGGYEESVDGTSASTPTFAAIIALLNDALISAGKAPLGFLNPYLYSTVASALTDITSGSSSGCSNIADAGWPAVKGWDPATGLGTPDFGKMLKLTVPQACNTKGVLGNNPTSTTCSAAAAT